MTHYLYKLACRSPEGRSFTLNIKTPLSHSLSYMKQLIEDRNDVIVIECSLVEIYQKPSIPELEKLYNLNYSGYITEYFNGVEIFIDISKKILPLYDKPFDSLNHSDWVDMQNYLRLIYGDTFILTYAQMCQAN